MLWSILIFGLLASCSALNLAGVPTSFTQSTETLSAISDDVANKFANEYISYMKTGIKSAVLRQIAQQLANMHSRNDMFTTNMGELGIGDQFFICTTCRASMNVIGRMLLSPDGGLNGPNADEEMKNLMLNICTMTNIQTPEVCSGLYDVNIDVVNHTLSNTAADSRSICGMLPMDICKIKQEQYNWSVKIEGSAVDEPKSALPAKSGDDVHILHITDIHYDPDYVVGSLAGCGDPLCCRNRKSEADGTSKAAGYWSDYRDCDSPLHMIEAAFDHMKETHKNIDFIYQTGDIVPHNVWSTTKESNKKMINEINDLIEKKFPGIPVYSCIGNHEPHPVNVFVTGDDAPENISIKWLFAHLYENWSKWLPASTKETILKGGYYTFSPRNGFRIIALNNNDCYLWNFWIYEHGNAGIEQLNWLHDTLLAAEKAGEQVHILAHIPSGDSDCWSVWAREYNRIIVRFHKTIGGIFNGHTHRNEMNVHYTEKGNAVAMSWNAGSLTSFANKNPNYRMYEVETKAWQVVDHETWIFNLTEANLHGAEKSPVWYKDSQFSTDFTDDMSPAGIDTLLEKMAESPELLRKYWRHKMTSADPHLAKGCDDNCLLSTICRLATTAFDNKIRCNELKKKLQVSLENEVPATTVKPTTADSYDDGAASLIALKLSTILGLYFIAKLVS